MSPEVRNFVNGYAQKLASKKERVTLRDVLNNHNHELWRVCLQCAHSFDARKEIHWDRCPKCNSKEVR